ncbi:Golgi vesicle transport [Spatholobus suberectus]|nr:Golgi vesicle transport [Spatholobus suberectus]
MLVANSFDLWRKDAFFSAAEEVQESADIMESAYRAWLREKRERSTPEELNELCRELQTALGTAKWQLEEFEKAVRLSYRHHGDDNTTTRHRQFISAIECQITQVEAALRESYIEEGKQPLRWVNLDEEERDDLAAFLSGSCQTTQSTNDGCMEVTPLMISSLQDKQVNREDKNVDVNAFRNRDISASEKSSKDVIAVNKDTDHVIEIKADAVSRSNDDVVSQTDRTTSTRKTWSPPNYGALKIVIADEDEQGNKPTRAVDATPKEKGFKHLFWKQKCEEYPQAMRVVRMFNQRFGRIGICQSQRQFQSSSHLRYGCSVQVTLALMLTIFLIVPFVLHST